MNSTPAPPLASIIVRTMGDPRLARALASLAAQTYRPLEVVLVDAAGRGIAQPRHAGLPVRVVSEGRLDRPRALNAGLRAARGDWIGLLDEDDELEREHLALLVATAMLACLPVAYSQTRVPDPGGGPDRVFGGPFHREALLRSNYIASPALIFHRRFVDQGLRFDESLALFEDWDFWLQLASRTDFAFSARPTAVWHAATGASGAGAGGNLDREAVLAYRERLMGKWARP